MLLITLVLQFLTNAISAERPIYQLSVEAQNCTYSISLNEFPITQPNESGSASLPLNLYLIGLKNQLKIQHKGELCQWELTI